MTNEFELWQVILIIIIVFAVVWGNIALLKYSAKMDMSKNKTNELLDKMVEKQQNNEQKADD
jgi:hypothetical protein